MPQHKEVVVDKTHGDKLEREHALVAIREVFDAAVRQIESAEQDMRGQVKEHLAENRGHVTKFLAGEDCGFIAAADGSEVYFHRNAVLDGAFDRLVVGSEVVFVEEEGDKRAQASTVRLIGNTTPPSKGAASARHVH
jgi:cold shock CspA family protein